MTIQEVSGNPTWAVDYYKRNEAASYLMFMGIAHVVGVQQSGGVSEQGGWAYREEIFNPVSVPEDPLGAEGPWTVQLAHSVRYLVPDKAASGLPFIVQASLRFSGRDVEEEMIRPPVHVYLQPLATPQIHLARASRLNHYPMDRVLQKQARYLTWLSVVEARVFGLM